MSYGQAKALTPNGDKSVGSRIKVTQRCYFLITR